MRPGGPDERLGILVVQGDVLLDGGGQFRDAAQASSASSAVRRPVQSLLPFASPPPKCFRHILDSADDK